MKNSNIKKIKIKIMESFKSDFFFKKRLNFRKNPCIDLTAEISQSRNDLL